MESFSSKSVVRSKFHSFYIIIWNFSCKNFSVKVERTKTVFGESCNFCCKQL